MVTRWLIGVSLARKEIGPLEFGGWLADVSGASLRALHVAAMPSLPERYRGPLESELRRVLQQTLAYAGLADVITEPEISMAQSVSRELVGRAKALDAGLVVGRAAPLDSDRIVRLGSVARRVLRHLPSAVAVVPPDLRRADIGTGPILVAADTSDASVAAIEYARTLSKQSGRELVIGHVFDSGSPGALAQIAPEVARSYRDSHRDAAKLALEDFTQRNALSELRIVTREGATVEELLDLAEQERASVVVCGSRRLSLTQRIFEGSVGSALAGIASVPVFIIPS